MPVDLSLPPGVNAMDGTSEAGGIVTHRSGTTYYTFCAGPDEDGDYIVRVEHGSYPGFTRDGLRCVLKIIDGKKRWVRNPDAGDDPFDIVHFERCSYEEAKRRNVKFGLYG